MPYQTQDRAQKDLREAQARARAYINHADRTEDPRLGRFLYAHADIEGSHADYLRGCLHKKSEENKFHA